jgi:AraC-like DNA-binding protein
MKIFIKNITKSDDLLWLIATLNDLCIEHNKEISLGELILSPTVTADKIVELKNKFEEKGFSIIHDRKDILIEQVKLVVMEILSNTQPFTDNYSNYICRRMHLNYTYLANIFSELQGTTIEQYIINKKIEKAKELLSTGDHSVGQVAEMLHYSSIGHFSNQFKKITGFTPSTIKANQNNSLFS